MKIFVLLFISILLPFSVWAGEGPYFVHDPVMIKQDKIYYMFCTGRGIATFSSKDMTTWLPGKSVFDEAPDWAIKAVPGYDGHTWAPDISFYKGKYYLFYSVSAFGTNTSCIGLAENKTLHPESVDFKWVDHGKIIESVPGRDDWNAIDPNLIVDEQGDPWLCFGSFWSGIKMAKMKDDLSGIAQPQEWYVLAGRPRDITIDGKEAGDGAIEAPFIFKKGRYYYLFVSFDYCCRGAKSDYKIMVGRSEKVTGPYVDKNGVKMTLGGGSPVVVGNKRYPGVGHCGVYTLNAKDYIIFHGYDMEKNGVSRLLLEELIWDSVGWPLLKAHVK